MGHFPELTMVLIAVYAVTQLLYTCAFMIDGYLFTLPVDFVDVGDARKIMPAQYPYIVLFYPVLRELKSTMQTTFRTLQELDYPADRFEVIAIPNDNDEITVQHIRELQEEFPFLQMLTVPPTSDPSWDVVWDAWDRNPKAYWWHSGPRAGSRDLPPKKTRQLIYAFYSLNERAGLGDFVLNYIDADSCPPPDHFLGAAAGLQKFDVLQAQNIAGNLLTTMAASWHAFDHMTWDGMKYPHLSAHGTQPYWMLGKGLFFQSRDLVALGGFHPWIAIEDPEVGMRFWANGKKLGILANPLIEEVPETFGNGITQRKRWVCGFFQSLTGPLTELGFTPVQKLKAWLNFLPCLLLSLNVVGIPPGLWALWAFIQGRDIFPIWLVALSFVNIALFTISLSALYIRTWQRTAIVLHRKRDRIFYMLRVNPLFLMAWWLVWLIPLWLGLMMYLRDGGLVWDRTKKIDANHALILARVGKAEKVAP